MKGKEKNLNAILHSNTYRDAALSYLSEVEKEELQCFGEVRHSNLNILHAFFSHFQENPNSNISFLAREENASIYLLQTRDSLLLFSDKGILCPSLFAKAMAVLLYRFYIFHLCNRVDMDSFFVQNLQVLLSTINGISSYSGTFINVGYDEDCEIVLFNQMIEKVDLFSLLEEMCSVDIDIALPISLINAEKVSHKYLVPLSKLEERMQFYNQHEKAYYSLQMCEVNPIVIDGKEFIIDFKEKKIDAKHTALVPIVEVDSSNRVIPSENQIRMICSPMDMLQRKIYFLFMKLIGRFSPISYGFSNTIFFSKEIVIQIGELIEEGRYFEQDNLAIHPMGLTYYGVLSSQNRKKDNEMQLEKENNLF